MHDTNTCENHHSFLRQWLAKFRGVSKQHLQKYLDFVALKLNPPETDVLDWLQQYTNEVEGIAH